MDQNVLDSMQKIVATAFAEKLFTDVEILLAAKNKILFHQAYSSSSTTSQKNSIFDLASLTKPLATSLAVMKLIEENKLSLKTPVADFFTEYKTREKSKITIWHLLTHTSGMSSGAEDFYLPDWNQEKYLKTLLHLTLENKIGSVVLYSCLDFILLSQIVSKVSGQSFKEYCQNFFYLPVGLKDTHFSPVLDNKKKLIPTAYDELNEKYLLGVVHDKKSRLFAEGSGNAGLFSTAEEIYLLCQKLLDNKKSQGTFLLKPDTINQMWQNQTAAKNLSWGLGWVYFNGSSEYCHLPSIMDKGTVGHLGFTGTSFFIEPEREAVYIILSNRVHLSYDENLAQMKNFRLKIHSLLYEMERASCS